MKPILSTEKTRILKTTDLSIFSLQEHLSISRRHLAKVKSAIVEKNLTPDYPILVDEQYNILEGKYRFLSCYELKLPIFYKVAEVTTLADAIAAKHINRKTPLPEVIETYKANCNYGNIIEMYRDLDGSLSYREILDTINWSPKRYDKQAFYTGKFPEWDIDSFKKKIARVKYIMELFNVSSYTYALTACIDLLGMDDNNSKINGYWMSKLIAISKAYNFNKFKSYHGGVFNDFLFRYYKVINGKDLASVNKCIDLDRYQLNKDVGIKLKKAVYDEAMRSAISYDFKSYNERMGLAINFEPGNHIDSYLETVKADYGNSYVDDYIYDWIAKHKPECLSGYPTKISV